MNQFSEAKTWPAIGFLCAVVYASFFEWTLHRCVMHRPFGRFRYPFESHTLVHHRVFRADETFHLINPKDARTIPMAWWNGPVLVALGVLPFAAVAGWLGPLVAARRRGRGVCRLLWHLRIHPLVHDLPRKRNVERSGIFFRLNGHHLLPHRYMRKNFNVVLPLADLLLGTLLLRSPPALPAAARQAAARGQKLIGRRCQICGRNRDRLNWGACFRPPRTSPNGCSA